MYCRGGKRERERERESERERERPSFASGMIDDARMTIALMQIS
jgi:hypothetical protein